MIYGRFMSDLVTTFPLEKDYLISDRFNLQNNGRQIQVGGGGGGGGWIKRT